MPIKPMAYMQADFNATLRRKAEEHWRQKMAIGERCPACGHMPGDSIYKEGLSADGQLTAWAVELARASTTPGEAPSEVGERLRTLHQALQGLHDGPASDPSAS